METSEKLTLPTSDELEEACQILKEAISRTDKVCCRLLAPILSIEDSKKLFEGFNENFFKNFPSDEERKQTMRKRRKQIEEFLRDKPNASDEIIAMYEAKTPIEEIAKLFETEDEIVITILIDYEAL